MLAPTQSTPTRRRRYLFITFVCIAVMGLIGLIAHEFAATPVAMPVTPGLQRVSTAVPSRQMLSTTATVPGVWVAREEVAIASPLDGLRVVEVLVDSGDTVSAGQVLAHLERTVLDSQTRQAEQAERRTHAEFTHATEQHDRVHRLLPAGAVSRQDYEMARSAMLAARAAWQQAQAAWDEQRARQAQTVIRAPFTGTIIQRSVEVGAIVGTQTTLYSLVSDRQPEFQAQIPQQLLPELATGMATQISTSGQQGQVKGIVRLVSSNVDVATGYGQSRIAIAETTPSFIRPGTVGTARITLARREVLAVDVRALRYGADPAYGDERAVPYVFVVEEGRARRMTVHLGIREERWVEIRGGIDSNSRVVIAGASLLQDGDAVQMQDSDTAAANAAQKSSAMRHRTVIFRSWLRKFLLVAILPGRTRV